MPGLTGHRFFSQMKHLIAAFLVAFVQGTSHADVIGGQVVGVTDGDTITLLDSYQRQHKIRLSGIDAPERKQAFGQRSRELLASLVFSKHVEVESDKKDRYGRTVGKVVFEGSDINLAMVAAGLAWHYKAYEEEQSLPDRILYAKSENEARSERRGLWVDPEPEAPWDWRHNGR
ncbi:thermonuclease family protein [Hydrogenophaga sp.]|uniref:thermonuclease family protein n=1 Tax=Hydrogenophaga sp. TaxID=1904254 RepID=UPI0025C27822|nr:thermonuclease family protein [Hydrogenophaga sp.]